MHDSTEAADKPFELSHYVFYSIYIFMAVTGFFAQLRLVYVIRIQKNLYTHGAYKLLAYGAAWQALNCISQIVATTSSLVSPNVNFWMNKINGAVFQASWAGEYPIILLLAINRMFAIINPHMLHVLFEGKPFKLMVLICNLNALFNLVLCLSNEVSTLWEPYNAVFYFTEGTFFASVLYFCDFYFAMGVIVISCMLYVITFIGLIKKIRSSGMRSVKAEVPLLANFFGIFAFTLIAIYLWHNPFSDTVLYFNCFNLLILFRFCYINVLVVMSNRTVRTAFIKIIRRKSTSETTTISKF